MIDFSKIPALCADVAKNWQDVVLYSAIIVCSVIAALGSLKPFVFNKIKNKLLRKIALSLSSLVLVMPFTALVFLAKPYSFDIYWYCVYALMLIEIIVYWLYENTGLRNGINKIGSFCFRKIFVNICASVVDNDNKQARERLVATNKELKEFTKETIKSSLVSKNKEVDKDLESL